MNRRVAVSAPGKLILMGEHAAVYGEPALVAAVDPRARVEASVGTNGLLVELTDLDRHLETTWDEAREHADRSREGWVRYAAEPTPERFSKVGTGSPLDLVMVALGELAAVVDSRQLLPLMIKVESRLPIGSGFGSSASIAVALIGGILTLLQGSANAQVVDNLAFEIERRQHGSPSGVDHKTVLHGGVVAATREGTDTLRIIRVETRSTDLDHLEVYQTGQPTETTGEVVAAVRRFCDGDRDRFGDLLESMGQDVLEFREQLELRDSARERTAELFRDFESSLEALGVVPLDVRRAIREVETAGGAAKISGAGALTGPAAGCLLVYWPDGAPMVLPPQLRQYRRQAVAFGVEGFRVEELR